MGNEGAGAPAASIHCMKEFPMFVSLKEAQRNLCMLATARFSEARLLVARFFEIVGHFNNQEPPSHCNAALAMSARLHGFDTSSYCDGDSGRRRRTCHLKVSPGQAHAHNRLKRRDTAAPQTTM